MARNTVLVTGASRGIGHAIAKDCQAKGMEVIGLSSKVPEGVDWTHYGVDLTSSDSGDQLKEIIEKHRPARFVGNADVWNYQVTRSDFTNNSNSGLRDGDSSGRPFFF